MDGDPSTGLKRDNDNANIEFGMQNTESQDIQRSLSGQRENSFMDTEQSIKNMVGKIAELFKPERIILFGSQAYGQPTADSDIDLMVIMRTEAPPHKRAIPIRRALKGLGPANDIIVKTPEEFERFKDIIGTIVYPAAHQGKVLYERR